MCYFLVEINNKFINGVKTEVGFLLSASGVSALKTSVSENSPVSRNLRYSFDKFNISISWCLPLNLRISTTIIVKIRHTEESRQINQKLYTVQAKMVTFRLWYYQVGLF